MRRSLSLVASLFAAPLFAAVAGMPACSGTGGVEVGAGGIAGTTGGSAGSNGSSGTAGTNGTNGHTTVNTNTTNTATTNGSGTGTTGTSAANSSGTNGSTGEVCSNLQCLVKTCPNGGHTTISGTILDPAGVDPLYNVVAYVPNSAVQALPAGATCTSCNSLFSGDPMADGLSDPTGHFVINDAPVSPNVPVIIQVGKWRTHTTVANVVACQDNPIGSIKFPSKTDPNDGIISLPDIAISTGSADSLECLMVRMGIDSSEYVPGDSTAGKVHIFNGGSSSISGHNHGGAPETNQMSGAPNSDQSLWNSGTSLAPYDIVLLSCEGDETYDAMPANLETYLNMQGGRVFASHYHYSWFTGATESQTPSYTNPSDWGSAGTDLAAWSPMGMGSQDSANGTVVTTLWNGSAFPKGQALNSWLGNVGALNTNGAGLYIAQPRENATVSMADTGSQPWITDPATGATLYFSFNTPLNASPLSEGAMCQGRAVFSGLHVGGASYDGVNCTSEFGSVFCSSGNTADASNVAPPPTGCDTSRGLSPQEKALEFMIFDLSSCVVADTANPADAGVGIMFK